MDNFLPFLPTLFILGLILWYRGQAARIRRLFGPDFFQHVDDRGWIVAAIEDLLSQKEEAHFELFKELRWQQYEETAIVGLLREVYEEHLSRYMAAKRFLAEFDRAASKRRGFLILT